ncbi:MAG: hypothetical protein ACI4TB_05640 [Lachnospiraceae bacterium]
MSDITAEKRLELIRNIREENTKNRMKLRSRENILYGQHYNNATNTEADDMLQTGKHASSLGLRILVAIVLFSLFIILDYTEGTWFSVNASGIRENLQENYIVNSFDFIKEITYTLNHAE